MPLSIRAEFCDEQDGCRQHAFCRIIEKRILSIAGTVRTAGGDNGLCRDFRIFFRFRFGTQVRMVCKILVHVFVDEMEHIITIASGRITEIDDCRMVAIVFFCNACIVAV